MVEERAKRLGFNDEEVAQISEARHVLQGQPGYHAELRALSRAITMQNTQAVALLLESGLKTHGPRCPLVMMIDTLAKTDALYERRGIDQPVRDATLADIQRWSEEHQRRNDGEFGLSQVFWIARHLTAKIVQLSSLQFEPKAFGFPYRAYQDSKQTMVVVAQGGVGCDGSGYITEADRPSFTTELIDDGHTLLAHRVDPKNGAIDRQPRHYPHSSLTLMADSGRELINIHIPRKADLSPAVVDEALRKAAQFFPTHPLFVCVSWLIDPALELVAQPEGNIVSFMRRFTKFGVPHQVPQLYERVFGQGYGRTAVLAHQSVTSLQKAVQRELEGGTIFRTMGGLIAPIG